ncbi:unnamed protein product [Rotaria sp. Silwood1]|nr:unnamed protein product [Rotaria sp. Silwood1]CAF4640581.1 unnamed protein product [Rotaria sp. Silwood1]
MEPTLCFRLCQTPIIYIKDNICRCSGGGLMNYNRKSDKHCSIPCIKLGNRHVRTTNTCGGSDTYSAYAENQFYVRYAHLFDYRIQYASCQLWNASEYYDTLKVEIDESSVKPSLNKLERCAAACFDQNATTTSIGFNDDSNQCLCLLSRNLYTDNHARYLTILPDNSCNRYCDNTLGDANIEYKFKCGSLTDRHIWAIYNLRDLCSPGFVYIKELKQCVFTYEEIWNFCPLSSTTYIYDGNITWNMFLKVIEKLKLTESFVSIDFDDNITIDPSWKCSITTTTNIDKINSNISNRNYVLHNGCLRVHSNSLNLDNLSYRLCIKNPLNQEISILDDIYYRIYMISIDRTKSSCPINWFDLNGHCYRISDEAKTIQQAKNSCINVSIAEENKYHQETIPDDDMKKQILNVTKDSNRNFLQGEITQYTSQWQSRLGFFLLDTDISNIELINQSLYDYNKKLLPVVSNFNINHSFINEFQMINPNRNDDSCILFTRSAIKEKENSILKNIQINNCSKSKHVLCKIEMKHYFNSEYSCYRKPLTLGLPTIMSKQLTYELCLSVCTEFETNLAVINIDKCYCLNAAESWRFDVKRNSLYQKQNCGDRCPGNPHEHCGDNDTIVAIPNHQNIFLTKNSNTYKLSKSTPDFVYDGCINLISMNQSIMYHFNLNHTSDIHPRHCLELCTNYKQKFALLNSNKCLCTNIRMKNNNSEISTLSNFDCTQECAANYFYTCGNSTNSSLYSVYAMQLTCPLGFQVSEDEQRCLYSDYLPKKSSLSTAQSYCKSIGGILLKINDILEIQDIVPKSMLTKGFYGEYQVSSVSHIFNNTIYFWIDHTSDIMNSDIKFYRSIPRCFETPKIIDQNCIVVRRQNISFFDIMTYERCFTESNKCSSMSAIPICVNQHLEFNSTVIPSTTNDDLSIISVNTTIDYSCDDGTDYHLMDQYCYKISFHETTWQDAKSECERENATLFLPEKLMTLNLIKFLFLRRRSYTSSSFAHIGNIYDNQTHTIMQTNITNNNTLRFLPNLRRIHTSCAMTFNERYTELMSTKEKERLKSQQTGCAYVDLRSNYGLSISCDEIPCNRLATVICQRAPVQITHAVLAQRLVF